MVIEDLNQGVNLNQTKQIHEMVPIHLRVLSLVIDYLIFAPVLSFLVFMVFREGLSLYKTYPNSVEAKIIYFYVFFAVLALITFFQSLFMTFWSATPGQYFLKIKVKFNNDDYPIFLQALFRQIGFISSFFLLGLPFLHLLLHKENLAFYERMTDSQIVTSYKNQNHPSLATSFVLFKNNQERKFWLATAATLSVFIIFIVVVVFMQNYYELIKSPLTYDKKINSLAPNQANSECQEFKSYNTDDRLHLAIAMNLAGVFKSQCLDQEADFNLWRNFSEDKSLAYLAKALTAETDTTAKSYIEEACRLDKKSEGCQWSEIITTQDYKAIRTEAKLQNIIGYVVLMRAENESSKINFAADIIKSYQNLKSFKKFELQNKIAALVKLNNIRSLASIGNESSIAADEKSSSTINEKSSTLLKSFKAYDLTQKESSLKGIFEEVGDL